jgi:hypothetical protein
MALGELFDLDGLALACAESGTYEGLFAAAPMHKTGRSASIANALAVF